MDQRIDLDFAAEAIARRIPQLQAAGVDVRPITWTDGQTTVNEITTDRSQVRGDYSVGSALGGASQRLCSSSTQGDGATLSSGPAIPVMSRSSTPLAGTIGLI